MRNRWRRAESINTHVSNPHLLTPTIDKFGMFKKLDLLSTPNTSEIGEGVQVIMKSYINVNS